MPDSFANPADIRAEAAPTLEQRREHERRKYLKLAAARRGYGRSNHGGGAYATVMGWQPRFVVDFGCGDNAFVSELRRRGVDGLGIDWANPGADVAAPMHQVPLAGGIADVVTSFDALEHLLTEDVDTVLAEMHRVARAGGRFCFSIATRPSQHTVDGEGLHPTVQPMKWWVKRIGRVGLVESAGRYVTGVFHA